MCSQWQRFGELVSLSLTGSIIVYGHLGFSFPFPALLLPVDRKNMCACEYSQWCYEEDAIAGHTAGYLLLLLLFRCQLSNDWPLPLMTSVDVCVCVCVSHWRRTGGQYRAHTHTHTPNVHCVV